VALLPVGLVVGAGGGTLRPVVGLGGAGAPVTPPFATGGFCAEGTFGVKAGLGDERPTGVGLNAGAGGGAGGAGFGAGTANSSFR
jgi:hypothetical protein